MADPQKKNSWVDPTKRAGFALDTILRSTTDEALAIQEQQTSIETELAGSPIAPIQSDRAQSRVLFITRDISVLAKDSVLQTHFIDLSDAFNEIHIIVLCESWQAKKGTQRLAKNVWVYTTSVRFFIQQPFAALSLADSQLRFADGFRPDVIVALDPFESGLSGMKIAEKYDREFQVHISDDLYSPDFLRLDERNKARVKIARQVLKRTVSVRTATLSIKEQVEKRFPHIKDISLLPRHYNIAALLNKTQNPDLQDAFPQFVFTILFVGRLDHESTLFRAMDASRSILVSKSIGLAVLGDGPSLKEFQERANILGIQEQVIFQKDQSKLIPYLASADVLVCTDTTEASDELVIKAAAAGLPMVVAKTPLREDLFVDGESAFLCNKEDTLEFSQKLVKFLNTNSLRTQFADNARDIVKVRLHEDPGVYKTAYRNDIEGVFEDNILEEEQALPEQQTSPEMAQNSPSEAEIRHEGGIATLPA